MKKKLTTSIQKAASIMGKVGGKNRGVKLSVDVKKAIGKKGGDTRAENYRKKLSTVKLENPL